MKSRGVLTCVVLLSSVSALASCSDDNDKAAISKSDFVAKANAFCASLNETIAGRESTLGSEPTEEQATALMVDVVVPETRKTIESIRNLGFPEGDETLLDGLMDETEAILDSIAADPASAFSAEQSSFADVDVKLSEYGLTVCAPDA